MFFLIWVNHLFLALKMTFCYRICCFCGNNLYIYHFSRFVMCVTRQGFLSDDKKRALLPKGQSALNFYIYIGIALFVYCFIACLQDWGITFFISIFYFCSLLRPLFSPNVGTTQTDILYLVTGKRQPLISDTFLISKQINDAETRPLSLPPPLVAHYEL